ncbi:MAG: hypothetical protein D6732_26115 [Methanobacteriota archaeon]|nr:MAG: hypothetical protein D6732_26115 [Euryarchaeota archaeon]
MSRGCSNNQRSRFELIEQDLTLAMGFLLSDGYIIGPLNKNKRKASPFSVEFSTKKKIISYAQPNKGDY